MERPFSNITKKLAAFSAILILIAGSVILIGCGDNEQAAIEREQPGQPQERAATDREPVGEPQERAETGQQSMGGQQEMAATGQNAAGQNQEQATTGQAGKQQTQESQRQQMLGKQVQGAQGNPLGSVEKVIGSQQGPPEYVILRAQEGDKFYPVPADRLQTTPEGEIRATFSQQELQNAPSFSQDRLDQMMAQWDQWESEIKAYYGQQDQQQPKNQQK